MKIKVLLFSVMVSSACNIAIAGDDVNKSCMRKGMDAFYSVGEYVGDIKVPFFCRIVEDFRIKHFLPCALIGCACDKYPKQTGVLLAGLIGYALYKTEIVRSLLRACALLDEEDDEDEQQEIRLTQKKSKAQVKFEDDLFVYQGTLKEAD